MWRKHWVVLLAGFAACSSTSGDDAVIVVQNNATISNNTSAGTDGANNTTGSTNTANNTLGTTTSETIPEPTLPFSGVCAEPQLADTADGCSWSWRCATPLRLNCSTDGTCQCVSDSVGANHFETDLCAADAAAATEAALEHCDWAITYEQPVRCQTGTRARQMDGCSWSWDCGDSQNVMTCIDNMGGYDCRCSENGAPNGNEFSAEATVCGTNVREAVATARGGCGWDIGN